MKRPLRHDEAGLWASVTATVRPIPGRVVAKSPEPKPVGKPAPAHAPQAERIKPFRIGSAAKTDARTIAPASRFDPELIEPNRKRRIARGREPIAQRLDLHGLDQDTSRAALTGFLERAQADGARAVLVITGKGIGGDGVLRRRAPEWLADPRLREVVAGVSPADRHHGGEGALYVALKRRPKS